MNEIEKKVDEQFKLVKEIREKFEAAEEGKFTKAEAKELEEKANKRYDEISEEIKTIKTLQDRIDQLETKIKRPGMSPDNKGDEKSLEEKAFNKWLRFGGAVLMPEEQRALRLTKEEPIKAELLRQFDIPERKS